MEICDFPTNPLLEGWEESYFAREWCNYVYIMFIVIICILAAIGTRQTQKVNSFEVVFSLWNKTIYLFFNYFLCTVGLWAASVWIFFYIMRPSSAIV